MSMSTQFSIVPMWVGPTRSAPRNRTKGIRVRRVANAQFIFNPIWAAIKRESHWVVAEGVSTPEDVDKI
jgi:3-hydroxyacyl-CoA dehydrogenase